MSLPTNSQALIAAFTFGITFQAGAGAFFLYVQGQGKKIFRDGLRLALTTFIASAALWSQIAFSATLIDPTSSLGCQVAVIFSSFFDQLARFTLEQYLLWAINSGLKKAPDTFVPQVFLMIRLVVGGMFVGFQRPQLQPVCQTRNEMFAIGIAVAASDLVMILIFIVRAVMIGLVQDVKEKRPGMHRSKAILFLIAGLALWTGTSVPMFLGIQSIDLIWRTALPAGTLSLLLGLVAAFMGPLVMSRARASAVPQDPSLPPDMRSPRDLSSRDISTAESNYPPSRFEDLKRDDVSTVFAYPSGKQVTVPNQAVLGNMAATTDYGPVSTAAATGMAVGRPSMDGPTFSQAQIPASRNNLKAQPKAKGNIFGRGGPASSITVGKLAISGPVLQNKSENGALNKIATIDLATAAKMDKERRDLATLQDSQTLVAQRAAPMPPAMTREEAMKRQQSFKRKQIATTSAEFLGPPRESESEESRPVDGMAATTTSLQPSPGAETVRRRSPRSSPRVFSPQVAPDILPQTPSDATYAVQQLERTPSARTMARQSTATTVVGAVTKSSAPAATVSPQKVEDPTNPNRPALPPTWPKQKSVRNTIRPSRTQASRSPESAQEPAIPRTSPEPSLQRRGTVGLPSNPRSRVVKAPGNEAPGRQPTVMFMKGIQYNDPVAVQNIIQDAAAKTPQPSAKDTGSSRESVLHRPRPIPRQVEKDRQIFPAEQSPGGHKRTKSGGSIASRLRDQPGSPSNLPPLPPAPKSAGYPTRPQPNDTRSMTFDEKMDLLFPGPKSAGASQPGGSVPEMPALPSAYAIDRNNSTSTRSRPSDFLRSSSRASESSAKTSVRTQSILEIAQSPARPPMPNTSKFSIDTYVTTDRQAADEVNNSSWLPGLLTNARIRSELSLEGAKRRSSPVLPINDGTISEFSDVRTRADEETATNWGSVHSPIIMEARQVQVPVPAVNPKYIIKSEPKTRDLSVLNPEGGKELMTIMLDPAMERERNVTPDLAPQIQEHWHHRVGDECASFSARKERVVSRRMPPPTPLLLSLTSKNSLVIAAAEPSPLESPQEALQAIQDQLKKFEEPDAGSDDDQEERLRLLESLEQEMGQQEDQWHEMQIGIHRDSLSTVDTMPSRRVSHQDVASPDLSSRPQSQRTSFAAHREARRASRLQVPSKKSSLSTEMTLSPASRRRSLWQRKLAEVELEYSENASDFLAPMPSVNYVSVPMAHLGSPTPPDTDSDNEEILRAREVLHRRNAPVAKLWEAKASVLPVTSHGQLWALPPRPLPVAPEDLPGITVRPTVRKVSEPLDIKSSHLWRGHDTFGPRKLTATMGLWRGVPIPEPPKPRPRPVTQRPPRRNKRVSTLADIVENPEPLPNKRGTLGIFQFPWGEKSDTATVQVRASNMFMAMPGTMSTGGSSIRAALEARSMQLLEQEQSSSYFEDYDEEEEDDDAYISEINEEEDSEGEFDETTLWEIASLLKSDQVPSKYSLLPQPYDEYNERDDPFRGESVFEASDYEMDLEDEDEDNYEQLDESRPQVNRQDSGILSFEAESSNPAMPLATPASNTLWTSDQNQVSQRRVGLPQPDERAWAAYIPMLDEEPRSKPRLLELPVLESTSLWTFSPSPVISADGNMWSRATSEERPIEERSIQKQLSPRSQPLWVAPARSAISESVGLFDAKLERFDFRTSNAQPAALAMSRKPRVAEELLLPVPSSSNLWSQQIPAVMHKTDYLWNAPKSSGEVPIEVNQALVAKPLEAKPKKARSLWAPTQTLVTAATTAESFSLFSQSQPRESYRTTSSQPAALETIRRQRVTEEPLAQLKSNELWSIDNSISYEYDWITIASVGPQSPSYASSSGRSTPISESASTKTASTLASSIAPSIIQNTSNNGFPGPSFPAWWEHSQKIARLSVLPEGPEETHDPETMRPTSISGQRRPAVSGSDWDTALQEAIAAGNSLKHRQVTAADWDQALREAVAASRQSPKLTSSPADWDAALQEAISLSSVPVSSPVTLWSQTAINVKANDSLWAPRAASPAPASSSLAPAEDTVAHHIRLNRAKRFIPKSRKEEIRAQIAAIESGIDPSIVGLVNFQGQSLWAPHGGEHREPVSLRGGNRNWISSGQPPIRASQAVFKFWLPGSGDAL